MADRSLAPNPIYTASTSYRLPEADRQSILAHSDSAKLREKIERQRQAFIKKYGSDGTKNCA